MHTVKVLSILFALIFCVSMLYGCGSDGNKGDLSGPYFPVTPGPHPEPNPKPSNISLSVDSLYLERSAGTSTIQIKADCAWSLSLKESSNNKEAKDIDWIKADPTSGTGDCEITLTFEDNNFIGDRACEFVVTSESGTTTVTASIKQKGVDSLYLERSAGTSVIHIKADCAWSISFRESSDNKEATSIDWIKADPSSGTGNCEITLTFEDNNFIGDRVCELVVTSESGTTATALITQKGVDSLYLERSAGTSVIHIKADAAWSISFRESSDNKEATSIDWIKADPSSGTGNCDVALTFEASNFVTDRVCELVVTNESGTTATALITQKGITYDDVIIGDKIIFGRYPQSADGDINNPNTYEPLTWVVDSKDNQELYMMTEKVIDNWKMAPDYFKDSELRNFFKGDFYNKAFNDEERAKMGHFNDSSIKSPVSLPPASFASTLKYCRATEYAISKGVVDEDVTATYWIGDLFCYIPEGLYMEWFFNRVNNNGNTRALLLKDFYGTVHWEGGLRPRIKIKF